MTLEEFWKVIDEAKRHAGDDVEALANELRERLRALSLEELVEFARRIDELDATAYRADLWGAAYIINGGCSDDGFCYFRAWLIAQGRKVFEAALANPDSLARHVQDEDVEFEELLYLPAKIYEERGGTDDFHQRVGHGPARQLMGDLSSWSDGGDVDEAKAKRLYPKLWRKCMA